MNRFVVITALLAVSSTAEARFPDFNYFQSKSNAVDFECVKIGLFAHPMTCTKFIQCDQNFVATEQECGRCDEPGCLDTKLHFDETTKTCERPTEFACPHPTTEPPTTTPEPATTPSPPETTTDPGQDSCTVNCTQTGYCACYDYCEPDAVNSTTGHLVKKYCDPELYWNPEASGSAVHGGACDFWDNLSQHWKDTYGAEDAENCSIPARPCEWTADANCDNLYFYLPEMEHGNGQVPQHLHCPVSPPGKDPLWWDQDNKSCSFKCKRPGGNCVSCPIPKQNEIAE